MATYTSDPRSNGKLGQPNAAHCVDSACDSLHIVGDELRKFLAHEIPTKILMRQARDVVLLSGPTGAGKEKVAAACHEAARLALGRSGELVEVNCANLGRGLFESELFGYRRGAFTGADRDYPGLAKRADNGTLVLDEIQALEPQDQARLLRFLGEREYRAVGDDKMRSCTALVVLSTNRDLRAMVRDGSFRRDLLDRAIAKIALPSLYERRQDIGELAQAFALEAGRDITNEPFYGLTRRARTDVETAVMRTKEVSVRRLREIIRNTVFLNAADNLPEALESEMVLPSLESELAFHPSDRASQDVTELEHEFDSLMGLSRLHEIAARHNVSPTTLRLLCRTLHSMIAEMGDQPRSYRNVVERANRLLKIALWLVSGAQTQAGFRRYFGTLDADIPTKSVAHQIYYDVFPREEAAQ